jgi:predicted ATPase/DNA-binding SARP family transcriptional activator
MTAQALMDAVWDVPPDSARNAIQVAISKLRRRYGSDLVSTERAGYRVSAALLRVDIAEAEQLVADARKSLAAGRLTDVLHLTDAAKELFAGRPLAGLQTSRADAARQHAEELRTNIQVLRARALVQLGRAGEAATLLRAEAANDPLNELVYSHLMEALAADGRPAEALKIYDSLRRRLSNELGVNPSPQISQVFQRLLNPPKTRLVSTETRPDQRQLVLPAQSRPMEGRGDELKLIGALFAAENRLVTLLGPGGIGKTRLAVAAAHHVAAQGMRSVFFIDLTVATNASGVRQAIAAAVGADGSDFAAALHNRESLVVLDNAEHVLSAAAEAARQLLAIQGVWVVATSRSPLKLLDERAVWLDALPAAAPDDPAVRLLASRAGFTVTDVALHGPDLLALARRGDGVPLVLELLAAELSWHTPRELLDRLDESLLDLSDDSRDRADRHLNVRAAMEWSLRQASSQARLGLAALTLVRGSFGLDAAYQILTAVVPETSVKTVLVELVDLSLIQRLATPGRISFRLLEPIRLSAQDSRLVPNPSPAAHQAHAAHYLGRLSLAEEEIHQNDQQLVSLLRDEDANLKLAMEWLWTNERERCIGLLGSLTYAWSYQSRHEDVLTWTQLALSSPAGTGIDRAKVALARYYTLVCLMKGDQEELDRLVVLVQPVLAAFTDEWHARWITARCEQCLSVGDFEGALTWLEQHRVGDPRYRMRAATEKLCVLLTSGRFAEAETSADALLHQPQLRDHSVLLMRVLSNRGYAAVAQGQGHEAAPFLGLALEMATAGAMTGAAAITRNNLAWASLQRGAFEDALDLLSENLHDQSLLNDRGCLIEAIIIAGLALRGISRDSEAETLAGAAAYFAADQPTALDIFGHQQLDILTALTQAKPTPAADISVMTLLREFLRHPPHRGQPLTDTADSVPT